MSEKDTDGNGFIEHQSRRMMSMAMYRKLKSVVDAWKSEEHAKAKVAAGAAYAFAVWFALSALAAAFLPAYSILVLVVGLFAWAGFVVMLIRRHLGATRQ